MRVGKFNVPMVGSVIVSLYTHRFGLTNESMTLLTSVKTADGGPVSPVAQERVAQYLESIGVL